MLKKAELVEQIETLLQNQLTVLRQQIDSTRESANEESKSSMGDKYETGRAMAHLEVEKLQHQITEVQRNLLTLKEAERLRPKATIGLGSLVQTSAGLYFLACGLGKTSFQNKPVFVVSLASPIGKLLHGKHIGDQVEINQKQIKILDVSA